MPTPVLTLVEDAAMAFGDPNKERVKLAQWLSIYNQAARQLCEKAKVLQYRGIFTTTSASAYAYPPEMTVMSALEVTDTPTDLESFRFLDEKFEDEFRQMTSVRYPNATLPDSYYSSPGWFYLIPRPTVGYTGGGRITYFGLPDRVTDINTGLVQTDDFTQDYLIRRMVIGAKMARNRLVEAQAELDLWYKDVEGLNDSMVDRSEDRRSSLAPRKNRLAGMR